MTGADHYREADQLLVAAENTPMGSDEERYYLGAAQVHATLALAAATALLGPAAAVANPSDPELKAWRAVVEPQDGAQ